MSSLMAEMFTPEQTDPRFISSLLLNTDQIEHLCEETKKILNSLSTAVKDGAGGSVISSFTNERSNLICLSNLLSISACIDTLRGMEPSLRKLVDDGEEEEMSSDGGAEIEVELSTKGGTRIEVEEFDAYRSSWELLRGPAKKFEEMTLLSPMIFTHCTPGRVPRDAIVGSTLQIYSVRITEVDGADLSWPLEVYGVIAARDTADNNRNPIFLRPRHNCQMLTLQDPFLHLMGPSRAILSMNPVTIEIQLKLKGSAKSEDRNLISKVCHHNGESFGTFLVRDHQCAIELCCEQVMQSVQATISRVQIVDQGSLPSKYGGRVLCCSLPQGRIQDDMDQSKQIVMLDSKDGTIPMGKHQCLNLSRSVVAVELEGRLKVTIEAYPPSGTITGHVFFTPQKCNITKDKCDLGDSVVEVTVAWSLLPLPKKS